MWSDRLRPSVLGEDRSQTKKTSALVLVLRIWSCLHHWRIVSYRLSCRNAVLTARLRSYLLMSVMYRQDQLTLKTKTTESKQKHLADLTFKLVNATVDFWRFFLAWDRPCTKTDCLRPHITELCILHKKYTFKSKNVVSIWETSLPISPTVFVPRPPTWASPLDPTGTSVAQTSSFVESKKPLNYILWPGWWVSFLRVCLRMV